jgi:hypothetical protein
LRRSDRAMTHYLDLTAYSYGATKNSEASARNVGWLAAGFHFPTSPADPKFVERLWRYCAVSVGQTRGLHECDICRSRSANEVERGDEKLLLGSAEIRVVSREGHVYAAPNLIYHYVVDHSYAPPPEFVGAVLTSPCPPEQAYLAALSRLGVEWGQTLVPDRNSKSFRFVKTAGGVIKVED